MSIVNNVKVVPGKVIPVTRTELLDLITNDALITNAHYEISGVCAYFFNGATIILQATSGSTLNQTGTGKFYTPNYPQGTYFKKIWNNLVVVNIANVSGGPGYFYEGEEVSLSTGGSAVLITTELMVPINNATISPNTTITGNWGGASGTITSTYSENNIYQGSNVIYGGKCWLNLTGNMGYDDSQSLGVWNGGLALNSGDWQLINYSDLNYYKLTVDTVVYDYTYDIIIYREDSYGNKIYENGGNVESARLYGTNGLLYGSNIIYASWGDPAFQGNEVSNTASFQTLNNMMSLFKFNKIGTNCQIALTYSKNQWNNSPQNCSVFGNMQFNEFKNSSSINGFNGNGYVSNNVFDRASIGSCPKSQITDNFFIESNIRNLGYVYLNMGSNSGSFYIEGNYGTLNQNLQLYNNEGKLSLSGNNIIGGLSFYNNHFGDIKSNGTSMSSNIFNSFSFQNNKFDNFNFYNNSLNRSKFNDNCLFNVDFNYNTLDASSYSGYDPQVGINGCSNETKTILSFTTYKLTIQYNNFQGRSGLANCKFENVIYFTNNTFNSSKVFQCSFINNSAFTDNVLTSSNFNNSLFNSTNFAQNTFDSSSYILNAIVGYIALNNVNSSVIQGNTGGSHSSSSLFRNTLSSGSNIKDNTFVVYGGISDCQLTSSNISNNNLSGFITTTRLTSAYIEVCNILAGARLQISNGGNGVANQTIIKLTVTDEISLPNAINSNAKIYDINYAKRLILRTGVTPKIEYFNGTNLVYTDYFNA